MLPKYSELQKDIVSNITNKKQKNMIVTGVTDSSKAHLIYSILTQTRDSVCVVCYNNLKARQFIQDLKFFSNEVEIIYLPARNIIYFDAEAESKEISSQRIYGIKKILDKKQKIIVTTIEAMSQRMQDTKAYENIDLEINVGDELSMDKFTGTLANLGYIRSETVEGKSQFSSRGGIIDIFPPSSDVPYRIEFFGNEIDSIRIFDKDTKRSISTVDNVSLSAADEYIFSAAKIENVTKNLEEEKKRNKNQDIIKIIERDIDHIYNGRIERCIDRYAGLFFDKDITLSSYLRDYIIYLDEPSKCNSKIESIKAECNETIKIFTEKQEIIPKYAFLPLEFSQIEKNIEVNTNIYLEKISLDKILTARRKEYNFRVREISFFRNSMDMLLQDLKKWKQENKSIVLVFPSKIRCVAVHNQLDENGISSEYVNILEEPLKQGKIYIIEGMLSGGYEWSDVPLVIVAETVSGISNKPKKNNIFTDSAKIEVDELNVGDFVVHINHGIGKYMGVKTITIDGIKKDYITITYDNNGVLYIPTEQLENIRKFICDENSVPRLNTLGSKEWERTKSKVNSAVKDIAKELIKLYATRKQMQGYAFSKDTPWQKEFEDTFPYEPTEDQSRSIEEVKNDMEQNIPMDRLLCGDVGYGKTEVAIRAAFKSVMDGKQVAYLVPTTVLASQQYETFRQRMEPFGIRVELLSRFRTKKQQDIITKKLKEGEIDIVIGTHRLLSKDVQYKDLGFLIIDEEHRFGVKHKETIKGYKQNVDVLSMTATPIPRTLHMSIIGIRDMSIIYSPPQDRLPVHTYVIEYNENVVKQAIENELERGGQVFYLYNRVEDIDQVTSKIANMIDGATVAFAHGQMSPNEVEIIMEDFIAKKIDILVCTTILESGIDIPNANTIIVENADRLGLAQLYQIRGRVGRSSRLAYAYITYKRNKVLTEESEKRLRAIKDFTEFGSGYKIAMRDLEIRGAGNILGAQQHGHMMSVGYDLYCRMLEHAINEEKKNLGEENTGIDNENQELVKQDVKIDVEVSSYIPDTYISDSMQKIEMYQKIAAIESADEAMEVIDEFIDRFGTMPKEVENLIKIVEIRNKARSLKIKEIKQSGDYIIIDKKDKRRLTFSDKRDILIFIQCVLNKK